MLSEQKAKATVVKALQPLKKAVTELNRYQLVIKDTSAAVIEAELRNDEGYARVVINKGTEAVEGFKWFTYDTNDQLPSEQREQEMC
ncbi:hypothetical protein LOK74_18045 [Brevibacillus humidisoli]|uniref:hypothetical protein n=1 Tax=Brevibacillus humidisoli TaxID=2895522 RepID=UPI001E2F7F40|nr:hypothetical protein [Brevibacillus humidisoli]UFJ39933.1 hypothetical protein LOK74_18045 [Brevibacillus humidisoli]